MSAVINVTTCFPEWPLARQTPGSSATFGENTFSINTSLPEYDAWVVYDDLPENQTALVDPARTILITGEPPNFKRYAPAFYRQFAAVVSAHPGIRHPHVIKRPGGMPWFVKKTYDEIVALDTIPKTKKLSIVTSNKQLTPEHTLRYKFALTLKEHFGDAVDLFGRGIRDFDDKWEVLAPYEYTVAIENLQLDSWITEKLPDCYLALTHPFYFGAPNIGTIYPEGSYTAIDIHDIPGSISRIEQVLNEPDHYAKHLAVLQQARTTYLEHEQLFALISEVMASLPASTQKKSVTLKTERNACGPVGYFFHEKSQTLSKLVRNLIHS